MAWCYFLPQRIMGASTNLCKNHAASRIRGNPKPSMNNSASKDVVCGRQYMKIVSRNCGKY